MVGYSPVSVPKKSNGGRTKPKKAKLILFRLNDVKTFPTPDEKGVLIKENLVLQTGAKAFFLETTASTISVGQTSEGDPDNKGFKQKIEFSRPGSDDVEFEEFMENNVNEDLCCIIEYRRRDRSDRIAEDFRSAGNPSDRTDWKYGWPCSGGCLDG